MDARHWDSDWVLVYRNNTNATNERTVISTVIPRVGVSDSLHVILLDGSRGTRARNAALLLGALNSLVLDFVARQKLAGTNLGHFVFQQLPMLPPAAFSSSAVDYIVPRVLELTYTASNMSPWAADLGYANTPFEWRRERRAFVRAELDAYYAHLFGLTRRDLAYVLDPADVFGPEFPSESFRVLRENEHAKHGEYRTRRLVLEAWDRLFGA